MEQRSDEWFAARLGKVTASRIADVLMKTTTAGYQNYLSQLTCERLTGVVAETFTSTAVQHGTDTEPQARAFYEMETGAKVSEVGFIDHPKLPMAGASPDGLVGLGGLVEIKCPQPTNHIKALLGGAIARNYTLQMQWQMACTGRVWCDFVSFCPSLPLDMQLHVQRVAYDPAKIVEISNAISAFLSDVDAAVADLKSRYQTKDAA